MANKVYITLEVDDKGSATMRKFGGNADKAFDKLKKNARAGTAQAGKMERAWEASATHMKAHWKGYALAGTAALAATAYAIKQFADASREEFKKYNTAVTDMGKITDESAESIKKKIGSIGPEYGDATELTKAYYNVISAGVIEPVAAMDTLKESVKAAKAAHVESADTVTGITALMEAYGDKIKGASESADLLFQIEASGKTTVKELIPYIGELAGKSAALGISQDELGASFAQVTLLSGSTSNAATQYKAILTSLMAPSEAMTKLLGKYGGAQKAIADMDFEGVLKLIAEESGGNAAALQKLMGSAEAVGGTLTLLGNDMAGYSQRLADMKDKTGLAEKAFSDWEKSMEGIEATYDASVKNIMIAFGEEIAPMVASSMQMIIDMGPTIINTIHTAFDFVQVSYISLVDHVMRGLIDIEYAFKTMVAGIQGAWSDGIDVLEEGFADFLESVAAGLDKIPFFSDNATASMRDLADKVRANTDESEGFVTAIMKVQAAKEKEVAAHNDVIDAMMAEALGYKETALEAANASVKKQKAAKEAADAVKKAAEGTAKAAAKLTKEQEKAAADFSKKYQKLTLGDHNYAVKQLKAQAKAYKAAGADHLSVEKWLSAEIQKLTAKTAGDKIKVVEDYARESTKIYERLFDDVQKLDLGDYQYSVQLLNKRYDNYKLHLESLAGQDQKYADGVKLLDTWLDAEKNKLWEDWASKHGSVLDRMEVRWRDYQKEGIDANKIMYNTISAGIDNMQSQLSDNLFHFFKGEMDQMSLDWESLWDTMLRITINSLVRMAAEWATRTAAMGIASALGIRTGGGGLLDTIISGGVSAGARVGLTSLIGGGAAAGGIGAGTAIGLGAGSASAVGAYPLLAGTAPLVGGEVIAGGAAAGTGAGAAGAGAGLGAAASIGMMALPWAIGTSGIISKMFGMGDTPVAPFHELAAPETMIRHADPGEIAQANYSEAIKQQLYDKVKYEAFERLYFPSDIHTAGYTDPDEPEPWNPVLQKRLMDSLTILSPTWGDDYNAFLQNPPTTPTLLSDIYGMGPGSAEVSSAREGGIFHGPESGYPGPTMHGDEAVIPLKGGKVPVQMEKSSGITIQGPLVNIEGTLIADEDTFNDFVEKIDERLYKLQQWGH